MRANASSGSPGRTYRFLETAGAAGCADCASWPFGFGGSYTTFALAWAAPPPSTVVAGDETMYELAVTNTGAVTGDVVVTCYSSFSGDGGATVPSAPAAAPQAAVKRPPLRSLFAFDRVEELRPGATAALAFALAPAGRTLVAEDGRQVASAGAWKVVCEAGGLVSVDAALAVV